MCGVHKGNVCPGESCASGAFVKNEHNPFACKVSARTSPVVASVIYLKITMNLSWIEEPV